MKEQLDRFQNHWNQQHKSNPEQFPLELDPGEWDEQFHAFTESEKQ